jgi:cysteine synthase
MPLAGLKNAVWTNQFDNVANRHGHFLSTGPEIWYETKPSFCSANEQPTSKRLIREQTNGSIDAFTCATGTGGTLAGVALFLKQKRSSIKCVLAGTNELFSLLSIDGTQLDPPGSVLFNKFGRLGKRMTNVDVHQRWISQHIVTPGCGELKRHGLGSITEGIGQVWFRVWRNSM